jgi:integrase
MTATIPTFIHPMFRSAPLGMARACTWPAPLGLWWLFSTLRHGLSTFLIGNGHDPVVAQRMLRQSHVDMTMHYVHNSRKARDAQAQFIERFLPNGATAPDAEEPPDAERVSVRVQ